MKSPRDMVRLFSDVPAAIANTVELSSRLDFTLADLMSGFAVITMPMFGARTMDDLPNIQRYADRLTQRPAWQKAMSIAGPKAKRPVIRQVVEASDEVSQSSR